MVVGQEIVRKGRKEGKEGDSVGPDKSPESRIWQVSGQFPLLSPLCALVVLLMTSHSRESHICCSHVRPCPS